jgi:hypothetical protein
VALISDASLGIPRNINNLCFNAMSLAYALQRRPIDSEIIRAVIADRDLTRFGKRRSLALHAGASGRRAIPAFRLAELASFRSRVSMKKSAFALTAILALSGVLVASRWRLSNKAAMHVQGELLLVAPTPSGSSPPVTPAVYDRSPGARGSSPAAPHASSVSVKPGETLMEICISSFGRCSPGLLQEIRRLNPQMNNLDHIEPGQTIQLPPSVANLGQPELSISGNKHE